MEKNRFFRDLLGLKSPWKVQRVQTSLEEKNIDVWLEHRRKSKFACPECGCLLPVHDHTPARKWRHLDSGGFLTWLHARLPRVSCLFDGVRQVNVPWAMPYSHFTVAFEKWAIAVLLETDVLGATRLLRVSWDEAWRLMERAVERGLQRKHKSIVARLGVDEKAIAKGHTYVTLVCDLDRSTVEYVGEGRRQESLDGYYRSLTAEQLAGIKAVAMDMWDPFIASTKTYVPQAETKIVFDRYHIMTHMNQAVDTVRKQEHRLLQAQEDGTLKGTKYLWLYAEENLPEDSQERFALLRTMNLKTARAWALKESLRGLWDYQRPGWAERYWQRGYAWAIRCRLQPVKKVARMLKNHLPNVMTYFSHRITNAVSEGLNSKIQTVKKTPTGIAIVSISRRPSTSTAEAWTFILFGHRDAMKEKNTLQYP